MFCVWWCTQHCWKFARQLRLPRMQWNVSPLDVAARQKQVTEQESLTSASPLVESSDPLSESHLKPLWCYFRTNFQWSAQTNLWIEIALLRLSISAHISIGQINKKNWRSFTRSCTFRIGSSFALFCGLCTCSKVVVCVFCLVGNAWTFLLWFPGKLESWMSASPLVESNHLLSQTDSKATLVHFTYARISLAIPCQRIPLAANS